MKKVVIVNGSPRKNGNTAALCDAFQDGVQSVAESAEVFRFDLNDYSFKGCQSCFSCKLKNGNGYGRCSLCLLYTSPSPRDAHESRLPESAW